MDRARDTVLARHTGIDAILLSSPASEPASVSRAGTPDAREFDRVIEADLKAPFRLLRDLLPRVPEDGRIVVLAVRAAPGRMHRAGASAAEAGLVGLVRSLALELAPRRISVNALLAAGFAWSPEQGGERPAEASREAAPGEAPPGQLPTSAELAVLLRFLLGSQSGGITGQAWHADGGLSA
jgi:3-oxoacyl-[acyl-carrier protein] reductase